MTHTIRVILADDHEIILDGLTSLLEKSGDLQVVGAARDGDELLRLLETITADVVVMDLQMPYHGFTVLEEIFCRALPVKVLILTGYTDADTLKKAVELGAHGITLKSEPFRQIGDAIRQVANGRLVYPQVAQRWFTLKSDSDNKLSPRELDVLGLISRGMTNSEIAQSLNVSKNTVNFHLKNIYDKLNVTNRTEATVWYFSHNSSFI